MARRIKMLLMIAVLCVCMAGCADESKTKEAAVEYIAKGTSEGLSQEFEVVYETDLLSLSFCPATTDIAVTNKQSNYTWSTANAKQGDERVYNILYLSYRTNTGEVGTLSSGNDSVQTGQYRTEQLDNGIKVSYTLGEVNVDYIYPTSLTPERYEYFYNQCSDDDKAIMEIYYTRYDIEFYDEMTQAELREQYPHAVDGVIYGPRTTMTDAAKEELAGMFQRLGYTVEDLETDHTEFKKNNSVNTAVNVSVYYTLEDDRLVVKVPYSEIQNDAGVYIESLNVLENFSGSSVEKGYYVLPDGSGSIMNFYNGKHENATYRTNFYGEDGGITQDNLLLQLKNATLPIWGCVADNNGYLAMITDGETHAYLNAVTGTHNQTARAWLDLQVDVKDYFVAESSEMIGESTKQETYQQERYDGSLQVEYAFFEGKNADYSHMASYYSDVLFGDKVIAQGEDYPLSVEMVLAVDEEKKKFGTEYTSTEILTDYEAISQICNELKACQVTDLNVILEGWYGIGYRNGYSGKFKAIKDLETELSLESFITKMQKENISLFLDMDVSYAAATSGVSKSSALRHLDMGLGKLYSYDRAVFEADKQGDFQYMLSPEIVAEGIEKAYSYANNMGVGVSLRNVGSDINSDFNEKKEMDREHVKNTIVQALEQKEHATPLMTRVGNAYVYPYTDVVVDVAARSNRQDMTDYSIPFVAMVLSGRVEYFGSAVNLSNYENIDILRLIESNMGMTALITEKDCKELKSAQYDNLYFTAWKDVQEKVLSSYEYLKEALGDTYGERIVGHQRISENVAKTTFASGSWIIVNYNTYDVVVDDVTVEALGYTKGGGQ